MCVGGEKKIKVHGNAGPLAKFAENISPLAQHSLYTAYFSVVVNSLLVHAHAHAHATWA